MWNEQAVSTCSRYQGLIKADGISGKADFHKQVEAFKKAELNVPKLKEQIQATEKGLSVFGAIMNGIEQANKNRQKEQKNQKTKQRYRGQKQNELEM